VTGRVLQVMLVALVSVHVLPSSFRREGEI
jgi:hypothetical protein